MKKRISPKVTSLLILAGTMTTASVISLAASSKTNNTTQLSTSEATTNSSTSTIATNNDKIASVSISNGYKSKITKENVERTIKSVQTEKTTLNDVNFKYPGVNSNYSSDQYRYGYLKDSRGSKKIDYQQKVMDEEVTLSNKKQVKYSDVEFANQQISQGVYLKHPAADAMYAKNISPTTKAITKQFEVNTNKKGTISLGLFAAPGEVVTIKFDNDTFNSMKETKYKGLQLIIGDNNFDEYSSNYNTKLTTSYPYTRTIFDVDPSKQEFQVFSPFGGAISLKVNSALLDQNVDYTKDDSWIKFEASGALECLEYVDGQTTKENWIKQIKKVKEGKITAPVFTGVNAFGSVTIPYTSETSIGGINLDDIEYPQEVFGKWKDLGYLGSYVAGKDANYDSVTRLAYNFSVDSNWGGGVIVRKDKDGIYASPEVGAQAFLTGSDGFSTEKSSELLEKIGTIYARDGALFKDTDKENAFKSIFAALTMLLDTGRERTNVTENYYSSTVLKNSYDNVNQIRSGKGDQRLALYLGLIYTVGPKNFIEYIRYSATNNPNTNSAWTPLKEIEKMSDFFKLNFYYAFTNSGLNWNAGWPKSYSSASQSEKVIIDKLNKNYKSFDIVGNMYAAGTYWLTNGIIYTGDSNTAYQITAGEDYVFDLSKFITSANKNFKFSEVTVAGQSKSGAKLIYNQKNKTVTYKASEFYTANEDEFNVIVKPSFSKMPNNYVSRYIWKIKVKQVTNSPLVSTYTKFKKSTTNVDYYLNSISKNELTPTKKLFPSFRNKNIYYDQNTREGVRYRFKFVAPVDGRFKFSNIWSDGILIKANGKEVYRKTKTSGSNYTETTVANLNKGQTLEFDITTMNMSGSTGQFGMKVENLKNTAYDYNIWDYVVIPTIDNAMRLDTSNPRKKVNEYVTNQRYVYKPRTIDYFSFGNNAALTLNSTEYLYSVIKTSDYTLSSEKYSKFINNLNDQSNIIQIQNSDAGVRKAKFTFRVIFKKPVSLSSVVFTHQTESRQNQRPTNIEINGKIGSSYHRLYTGTYGSQFNDRGSDRSGINLSKTYDNVSELTFNFTNNSGDYIIFRKMYLSSSLYAPKSSWTYHNEVKSTIK